MEINLNTVSKIPEAVSKIKLWVKEHKGLILIVAVVLAGIAFLLYRKGKKTDQEEKDE
jgi:type II secretory pathway component PulF